MKKIGIIDSGIGGRGIKKEIKKLIPQAEIIYFADSKNFPYGTKEVEELNRILEKNISELISKGTEIIVLACNSATVTSINYLRERFNIPIVGVEPAIKMAAKNTKTKNIAVFATPITSKSEATDRLINEYCKDIIVYKIPFENLAGEIENNKIGVAGLGVTKIWENYKNKNIDVIVLGCTHYTLIKNQIQKIVGDQIELVDSNSAVAQQVKKVYDEINID
ncbi:MAG: glutamate racemase, glutamate racemase [Berkelbacteria bacterium GW2011_GWE1_39_12]|uniref:Glutamate racemase n=1 Tax=Berkelbacteria bacterium GW2011_GWE1_39_12 TaxID=1618337 RepID=A0A0G4B4L7_9BACT|nr:MAG: glutamate racemase, glutamate racemase [Berkelbacteria bacterium GW2011_GWE1_39_12]